MNPRSALALGCFFAVLLCLEGVSWLLHRVEPGPNRLLLVGLFSQGVWICTAVGGAAVATRASMKERLGLGPSAIPLGAWLLLLLGFVAFSHGLYQLLDLLQLREGSSVGRIDRAVSAASQGPSLLLAIVAFGLAPGFGEELLFRGLIQQALTRRFAAGLAILVAAGLFALAHGDGVHAAAAFPLGLFLGLVAQLGRSVRPAIACHVVNNCLGIAALGSGVASGIRWGPGTALASLALGAALATGVAWWLARSRPRHHGLAPPPPGGAAGGHQAGGPDRRL